jgi:hypothetical protein
VDELADLLGAHGALLLARRDLLAPRRPADLAARQLVGGLHFLKEIWSHGVPVATIHARSRAPLEMKILETEPVRAEAALTERPC